MNVTPTFRALLKTTRPSFLVLTPICVFLGASIPTTPGIHIETTLLFIILLGATCAHISVNTLNEYYDFNSGLDLLTDRTPFSGGSGALPDHPEMARPILKIAIFSLVLTIAIGCYLIYRYGSQILPVGVAGLLLVITYTQWLNRHQLLCLLAPGAGFGILIVIGTHVVLYGQHTQLAWLISLVPFLLINNLLLLNQYPDVQADASIGRKTFPIVYGPTASNIVYAVFALTAYTLILAYIFNGLLPELCGLAITPAILSLIALTGAVRYGFNIGHHPIYMASNVAAALLTPLLLAASLALS